MTLYTFTVIISIIVVGCSGLWKLFCRHRRLNTFGYFKKLGIPGPEANIFWGHHPELLTNHVTWIDECMKKYGDTFGAFWGDKPFLITRDLRIQEEVVLKQFSNFVDRGELLALEDAHPTVSKMIINARGDNWRKMRNAITPCFSVAKLKRLSHIIVRSIDDFEEILQTHGECVPFDVYVPLKRFSLDNIGRTAFGIDAGTQLHPEVESSLLKSALATVEESIGTSLHRFLNSFSFISSRLTPLVSLLFRLRIIEIPLSKFSYEMDHVVNLRKATVPKADLLQALIDAQGSGDSLRDFSEKDVVGNAVAMFLAGYETTASALTFILHAIADRTDVQEKLRAEIVEATDQSPEKVVDYDLVMSLKYLDRVIKECLRLFPPIRGFTTRRAQEDVVIDGVKYPAGLAFYFPTDRIHLDPRNWEDPLRFDPDRFTDKAEHSLAYQPFGYGYRNCIGMRFALLTIKLLLCRVLSKYELRTETKIELRVVPITVQPKGAIISFRRITPTNSTES